MFVENFILLPKGINEYVVFLCLYIYGFDVLPFYQIFIIGHKGTIFSQNNNSVSECIFFSVTKM